MVNHQNWIPYPREAPHTVTGNLIVMPDFPTTAGRSRRVWVLLPDGYDATADRFPVLYMHDGQNLFDAVTSFAGDEWQVDETMALLAHEHLRAIVVGIDHGDKRRVREYSPPFAPHGEGDRYLGWLFHELKPRIDADFRTLPGREHTAMAGSSMGGLISLYAYFQWQAHLGGVIVMSPSLWLGEGAIYDFVRNAPARNGRIYLDNGAHENSVKPMAALLQTRGYRLGEDLKVVYDKQGRHNESSWARRLPDALRFLLARGTT
jgi:predicted alpha/beta superfamily hydrolase